MALLAEQGIAAVTRADALDRELLREVHDEAAIWIEVTDRVQALHEGAVALDALERRASHARHDPHVEHDVRAVGDFHAATCIGRRNRPHAIGHDVHRAPFHAAREQRVDLAVRLGRVHPVVVWTRVVPAACADEGQVLDACHIRRMRAVQMAVRERRLVEFEQVAPTQHGRNELLTLDVGSRAPVHAVGPGERGGLCDPVAQRNVGRRHQSGFLGSSSARGRGRGSHVDTLGTSDYSQHGARRAALRQLLRPAADSRQNSQKKAPSEEGAIRGRPVSKCLVAEASLRQRLRRPSWRGPSSCGRRSWPCAWPSSLRESSPRPSRRRARRCGSRRS